jgi:hypothetical protein
MKKFLCLLLASLVCAPLLLALPRPPHLRHGVVKSIDAEKRVLTLEAGKKDDPTELTVVDGRTKLLCDKKPAVLGQLAAGQKVSLYYVLEAGVFVATEVSWRSDDRGK